jgi:hypothetical protein
MHAAALIATSILYFSCSGTNIHKCQNCAELPSLTQKLFTMQCDFVGKCVILLLHSLQLTGVDGALVDCNGDCSGLPVWTLFAAFQEAVEIWEGTTVTIAFITLLLLSILKIVMGAVWIAPPLGILAIIVGVLGIKAAVVYFVCRVWQYSTAHPYDTGVFTLDNRMLVVRFFAL